jgi:hypothetical protein
LSFNGVNRYGGAGSSVSFTAGAGGNAANGTTNTGGNGGTVTFTSGTAGTGATAKGTYGDIIFKNGSTELARFYNNGAALGLFGLGVATPSAILHLKAGTATAGTAPTKWTPVGAVLNTNPEIGAWEPVTDDISYTIATGTARKQIVMTDGTLLTATRVPFAGTNGRLVDDADMTFATDTLTVTKIKSKHYALDGTAPVADGTYTVGARLTPVTGIDGTITVKDGIITAIQPAT